jgi:hypothetical protein
MNAQRNTIEQLEDQHEESTYALLIRSEEKSRNVLEVAIYPLLILSSLVAICQFAQQPINIPSAGLDGAGCVVCAYESQTLPEDRHPQIKG